MPVSIQNQPNINAETTSAAFLVLLTLTSPLGTITLVNNNEPVVSRGITFDPFPFSIVLPSDDTTRNPTVTIEIDNIEQQLTEAIRALDDPPMAKIEVITSAYPNIVERTIDFLRVQSADYNALTITLTLGLGDIMARKFPADRYDPVQFPGLFY